MIEVKNLSYIYQTGMNDEHKALSDINLTIADGETVAVMGSTGSGKSTLCELLAGLLKPSSGQVILDGADILELKRSEICKKVGLVFQYPENQLFEETVEKDIAFGLKNAGYAEGEIRERVESAAAMVGLSEECFLKSPFELSGGEMRRAAIAGVIVTEPKILILDEPTAGLDPKGRNDMFEMMRNMKKKRPEMTVIFISHSVEDVVKTAERVIVINNGKIETDGSVDNIPESLKSKMPLMHILKRLRLQENIYDAKTAAKVIASLRR